MTNEISNSTNQILAKGEKSILDIDKEIGKLDKLRIPVPDNKLSEHAIEVISNKVPEIIEKTQSFGRQASQHTLGLMTLTMLNGSSSPIRLLRQISVEIQTRVSAIRGAQVSFTDLQQEIDKLLKKESEEGLDQREEWSLVGSTTTKFELVSSTNGSLKDLAALCNYYTLIKNNFNIEDEWDEAAFEKDEMRHHVRRCFEMLYRNLITSKSASESTMEYMQQHGLHPQVAIREVAAFINFQEQKIEKDELPEGTELEEWLDGMGEKYKDCPKQLAKRIFGTEDFVDYDIMYKNNT